MTGRKGVELYRRITSSYSRGQLPSCGVTPSHNLPPGESSGKI